MGTETSFLDDIASHDAEFDERVKRILAQPPPRKPKVVTTSPTGIRSKPRVKPAVPAAKDDKPMKSGKRVSPEARRAALERK